MLKKYLDNLYYIYFLYFNILYYIQNNFLLRLNRFQLRHSHQNLQFLALFKKRIFRYESH